MQYTFIYLCKWQCKQHNTAIMWNYVGTAAHISVTDLQGQNIFRLVTPAGRQCVGDSLPVCPDFIALKGLLMADSFFFQRVDQHTQIIPLTKKTI